MRRHIATLVACLLAVMSQAAVTEIIDMNTSLVPDAPLKVKVITPEGYEAGAKFPTVYLLNGFGGNHEAWNGVQPRLQELADDYGMVMVMPDGRDSWYWDAPMRPEMKMETFIITELVPYIDTHYPTKADAKQRAVTGLSMGGQGAMWLAINHPDVFGSVGSTSGGVDIRPFPKNWKMANWLGSLDDNPQAWEAHSIVNLVPKIQPGELNIIFDCGTEDFFAEVNNNLHTALLAAGVPHDYISRPGNHSGPYWRNAILYQLLFFNEAFNRAASEE